MTGAFLGGNEVSKIHWTSDLHFGHKNIIQYCNRPFASVDHMNEMVISRWNSVVASDDIVYLLGDVSFLNQEKTAQLIERLNGGIYLIKGNHDRAWKAKNIIATFKTCLLSHEGFTLYMSHYPEPTWPEQERGAWHLHGHCHGKPPKDGWKTYRLDVGADVHAFKPISFETIQAHIMAQYIHEREIRIHAPQ